MRIFLSTLIMRLTVCAILSLTRVRRDGRYFLNHAEEVCSFKHNIKGVGMYWKVLNDLKYKKQHFLALYSPNIHMCAFGLWAAG